MEEKTVAKQNKPSRVAFVFSEGKLVERIWIVSLLQCIVSHFSIDLITEYPAEVNIDGVINHYAHPYAINNERDSKPVMLGVVRQYIKRAPAIRKLLRNVRKPMTQIYKYIKGIGPLYTRVNGSPQWGTPEFINLISQRCTLQLCDVVIAVDVKELIVCHQVVTEVPIIYYSLELYHRGHPAFLSTHLGPLKYAETMAFKDVASVIIQDEERARFLWKDNQRPYEPEKVILFPVSSMGQATIKRSDYFRTLYPEFDRQKLLLQMGNIHKYRRSDELIKIASLCPERYAMIFHGFNVDFYKKAIDSIDNLRCRFSQAVESFHVEKIAAGTDIGLVFYLDNNFNERFIAHASATFSLFMKFGIPVLVGNIGSLSRIVRQYNCGIVVEDLGNLFRAADQVMENYESYSQNAVRCFEGEHQLSNYCENLIDRLAELCKPRINQDRCQ